MNEITDILNEIKTELNNLKNEENITLELEGALDRKVQNFTNNLDKENYKLKEIKKSSRKDLSFYK